MKPHPRTVDDSRLDAEQWARELFGQQDIKFVVVRYEREHSRGRRNRKDLLEAESALFDACKIGKCHSAQEIISSLKHYKDSGFAFADSVDTLTDVLTPRIQQWQVNYDLADWDSGGAMLTVWRS